MLDPFLAILSHSPSEVVWCSSSHVSHALREANGIIGRSDFLVVMASPFRLLVPLRGEKHAEVLGESGSSPSSLLAVQDHAKSLRGLPLVPKVNLHIVGSIAVSCGRLIPYALRGEYCVDASNPDRWHHAGCLVPPVGKAGSWKVGLKCH